MLLINRTKKAVALANHDNEKVDNIKTILRKKQGSEQNKLQHSMSEHNGRQDNNLPIFHYLLNPLSNKNTKFYNNFHKYLKISVNFQKTSLVLFPSFSGGSFQHHS